MKSLVRVGLAVLALGAASPAAATVVTYDFGGTFVGSPSPAGTAFTATLSYDTDAALGPTSTSDAYGSYNLYPNAGTLTYHSVIGSDTLPIDVYFQNTFSNFAPDLFWFYTPYSPVQHANGVDSLFMQVGASSFAAYPDDAGLPGELPTLAQGTFFFNIIWNTNTLAVYELATFAPHVGGGGSTGAVPEPATWALLILGFFGGGMGLRRRRDTMAA